MKMEYKDFLIQDHKKFPRTYEIVTAGQGGSVPNTLVGGYTSPTLAIKAIDFYLMHKPSKGRKPNASKTESTG